MELASTSTENLQTNGVQSGSSISSGEINYLSKKNIFYNNTDRQSLSIQNDVSNNNNNGKEATSLSANQLFRKQLDISKAVRGIGDSMFIQIIF